MSLRDKARNNRLKRTYNITLAEYNKILYNQGKACYICKEKVKPGQNRLAVDHCHLLGLVRGLLCWNCNRALAKFRDDPARLLNAYEYLLNPPATKALGGPRFTAPGKVGAKKRAKLLAKLKSGEHAGK